MLLQVESIGYLVPGPSFDGTVHSVFARACNIACRDSLLTFVAPGVAAAPTALVLARGANDLRSRYRVGDAVARRVTRLPERASIVHLEGRAVCARLERACRHSDVDVALTHASRLIGWGEGLTPAGGAFLVGMLAALHTMTSSVARATVVARLGDALEVQANRTTSIAAHALRLAAHGHFSADLHRLRDALLSADDVARVRRLAGDAPDVGATSGVDRVARFIAGVSAWLR